MSTIPSECDEIYAKGRCMRGDYAASRSSTTRRPLALTRPRAGYITNGWFCKPWPLLVLEVYLNDILCCANTWPIIQDTTLSISLQLSVINVWIKNNRADLCRFCCRWIDSDVVSVDASNDVENKNRLVGSGIAKAATNVRMTPSRPSLYYPGSCPLTPPISPLCAKPAEITFRALNKATCVHANWNVSAVFR